MSASYGFSKQVDGSVDEVRPRVEAALKAEGFGILTEIDVKTTFKKKLDVDFRHYTILGACNPNLAKSAIEAEPEIGLLLPCNVVLQEVDGGTKVSIADPRTMASMVSNDAIEPIMKDAEARLRRAIDAI
jgi:uncharacterized protein (DUF302 family)